jgi:hypothetical protein
MKSAYFWLLTTVALGTTAFAGCGSTSDSGDPSSGAHAGASNQAGAGTANGGSGTITGGSGAGGATPLECDEAECGPQLGLPNWTCADGGLGGPTGRCIEQPTGSCGWEINDCPPAGQGGAPHQGGQGPGGAAGEPGAGGATTDACGGCEVTQICVQQLGGPGPGGFRCAMQEACSAPGACACIVGQGTCQPQLMGSPPGYCVCDNGLD